MRRALILAGVLGLGCTVCPQGGLAVEDVAGDGILVQIVSTRQEYDPFMPWQKQRPSRRSGYGVIVGPGQVLTTEHIVRNATLVELFAPRAAQSIEGTVLNADPQINLALISVPALVDDVAFQVVDVAAGIQPTDAYEVLQLDETRGVQRGGATELKAEVSTLPWAPYATLTRTLLADQSIGGEGAPVLQEGALAGLVMRYDREQRTADMLPCRVIRRFMADTTEPPYVGFAAAGFIWRQLVDPVKREWLKVDAEAGGVLVLACVPGSDAARGLKPNDVLLDWDGHAVDRLGFYDDPALGRILFPHLIKGERRPGEVVRVNLVRDGERISVDLELEWLGEDSMLIPSNTEGTREEYLVEGGFIIRELTGRYLRAHGSNWKSELDTALVQLYTTRQYFPDEPGQRVLIVSRVLPHPINVGYQHFHNRIITQVNGTEVHNMADLFDVRRRDGAIHRLTLKAEGVDLVMDRNRIEAANRDLQRLYNIPALSWQRDAGDGAR